MRKKQNKSFDREEFGKRLRLLREQADITQDDFARMVNRTRVAYVLIEGGKTAPSADFTIDALNVLARKKVVASLDYLFGITTHQNQGGIVKELADNVKKLESDLKTCEKIRDLQERILEKETKK